MDSTNNLPPLCPIPSPDEDDRVSLAHGEGGRWMRHLIRQRITAVLSPQTSDFGDAAVVETIDGSVAITTDSYVVSPLFFPGGDIGSLAVYGTVNDLAVSGAKPLWLTLSLIIEEGLPFEMLDRVIHSVADAARRCNVRVVAGDTKVVPSGAVDRLFLNTTGVGRMIDPAPVGPQQIREGDVLMISGPIGRHGIAVMAARESLGFTPPPQSDSDPLHEVTSALQSALGKQLIAMRDATRGGVSAVLHEWAQDSGKTMKLLESLIPVSSDVRGACELLGLDPLYVANEGTFVVAVAPESTEDALRVFRSFRRFASAVVVGHAMSRINTAVVIERLLGNLLPLDEPAGAPLPRIC